MPDEITPEQDAAVRRLLGQVRHDEAIPDEVAARLDQTLAGLEPLHSSVVADLGAARRRRRNASRLLLAAAAVVVAGVGLGQVVHQTSRGESQADRAHKAMLAWPGLLRRLDRRNPGYAE